jgi:2-dehydropantoate 2-reductase
VDNEAALAGVLGPEKVVPATVSTAIGRRAPGDIVLEKLRGLGIATSHPLSRQMIDAANSAFLVARPFSNAKAMKWSKLLTNLIANASSAILDMTAAAVFANPSLYALEVGMLRECLAVMQAQRIPVVDLAGTPVRALAFAVRSPLWISKPFLTRAAGSGRGDKMPSFHIDLHSGRGKSEVEYLHGAVVRAGRKFGVPTPICELLTETLVALTRGTRGLDTYAHDPAKLLAELHSRNPNR